MARAARSDDSRASSRLTSLGTLPKGPAGDPSGPRAPWPEMWARLPRARTQAKGIWTPAGSLATAGNPIPSSSNRRSISILPACTIGHSQSADAVSKQVAGGLATERRQNFNRLRSARLTLRSAPGPTGERRPGTYTPTREARV